VHVAAATIVVAVKIATAPVELLASGSNWLFKVDSVYYSVSVH